jgi:type IV pilus assembly protein PilO
MQLNLKQIPWYWKVAGFGLLAVAALASYYYFYEMPARDQLAVKQRQLDGLRVEINRGRAIAQKLQAFQGEVIELESKLEGLKAVLPETKDVGDLLRKIQTLATQSNLDIRIFKPQPVVNKQMHAEWPISLELEGTYHDLGMFFDRISKVPRIINVSNIVVKARSGQSKGGPERTSTIVASCLATTFVMLDTPAGAATPGAKGGKPGAKPAAAKSAPPKK